MREFLLIGGVRIARWLIYAVKDERQGEMKIFLDPRASFLEQLGTLHYKMIGGGNPHIIVDLAGEDAEALRQQWIGASMSAGG